MTCFLVEIPMPERDGLGIVRAMRTLASAQARLSAGARPVRLVRAGLCAEERRLVCVFQAAAASHVRDLVALAFLPAARVREVSAVDLSGGTDPIGDLCPGVQP